MTQTFITLLRRFTDSLMWRYSSDCQAVKRRISLSTIRSYKFLSQSIILQFLNFYIFHFTLSRNHYVMRPFSRPCAVFPYKFSPTHNFFFPSSFSVHDRTLRDAYFCAPVKRSSDNTSFTCYLPPDPVPSDLTFWSSTRSSVHHPFMILQLHVKQVSNIHSWQGLHQFSCLRSTWLTAISLNPLVRDTFPSYTKFSTSPVFQISTPQCSFVLPS